jgi:hypothetical protein
MTHPDQHNSDDGTSHAAGVAEGEERPGAWGQHRSSCDV